MKPQPYRPIPTGQLPQDGRTHPELIRPVELVFVGVHGAVSVFRCSESYLAMARLKNAAQDGETVSRFVHDGRECTADSLAALNCYLRARRTMGRQKLPFDRLPESGTHRYAWAAFCEHLALDFS